VVAPDNVLGVLSLIFWSLVIIISIKYLVFVMRTDNDGEGGILALTSLIRPRGGGHWHLLTVAAEGLAHGIQRAGADVAVDDAQRPERRRRQRRLAAVVPTAMIL